MATTNLLQWNPTAVNQENDTQYNADSQRAGGATNPSVFQAELGNKAFYQWSTYLTALFQAFANKGFTTSDSNINTLTATCANFLTTADVKPVQLHIPFSTTPVFDGALANGFRIDLSANVTSSNFINVPPSGTLITFYIVSASPGNFSFAWPSQVSSPRNVQTESQGNLFTEQFISDGFNMYPLSNFMNILAGQVATAQNTANTAITNAAAAQGTANSAQSTANTAVSNAAAAQSTANTAVSNAATAQSTANSALSNANVALAEIAALAVHSTRNDVTGARSYGTTYTNTSGGVMYVTGYGTTVGSTVGSVQCVVNGGGDFANTVGATVDGGACGWSFVVPAGSTYGILANTLTGNRNGVNGIGKWIETVVHL